MGAYRCITSIHPPHQLLQACVYRLGSVIQM